MLIYVDINDTLTDYSGAYAWAQRTYPELTYPQSVPGFFHQLACFTGAIETVHWLDAQPEVDVYILSAPSIYNPHSYTEKRLWVEDNLGFGWTRRLILSPDKGLLKGDYLIDDKVSGCGQELFEGQVLHFGSVTYLDWDRVQAFFREELKPQ